MLQDVIKDCEQYNGKSIVLNDNDLNVVGIDEVVITDDSSKILFTEAIRTCVCLLVIGEDEVGMSHLNIREELNVEQQIILKQLLSIKNIKEIDAFIGPKTSQKSLIELNKYIPTEIYLSYIDNPLGIDASTGNIAYKIDDKLLFGYNYEGFVEYKKGYINALNSDEFIKKI